MIPCVSFTELFPDHHAPTSHYQTMIAGKHRIEHSKLTIFHITPPLPYSLLLPTPFPLHHFPFHFYSASLPSPRHSLVPQLLPFSILPLSLFYLLLPLLFRHFSSILPLPFPQRQCFPYFHAVAEQPHLLLLVYRPHKPLYNPPLPPQRHHFPHFPAVAEAEEAKRGQMRTKYLLKIWFIK